MTIGIITCNYGRTQVLKIFCEGIRRLREETGLDIPVVCVGGLDGYHVCSQYGIQHIMWQNKPLTTKFNIACEELFGEVDYAMILGSDNVISTRSFLRIKEEAEKGTDLIGLSEVYMFAMDGDYKGRLYHFTHTKVLGVGRTISARVLDKVGWRPWNIERSRAIDVIMLDNVRPHVKTSSLLTGEFVVDLKTKHNLNPIDFWSKKLPERDINLMWSNVGMEERKLIEQYLNENKWQI